MKNLIYILLFSVCIFGCEYGDLNENPNAPTDVPESLLITGTMLANVGMHNSHMQRISGMWTSQYTGEQSVMGAIQNYNISTEESNGAWEYLYNGIKAQNQQIQAAYSTDPLIMGITKTVEASAFGTGTANWGNIPYAESVTDGIDDPVFESQLAILASLQTALDSAISDLQATDGYALPQDIFYGGDKQKWLELAYSLKAKYYMLAKDYPSAFTAATNGISSGAGSLKYHPPGTITGDQNLLFTFLSGSRQGDMSVNGTYLSKLLDASAAESRDNAKTNEDARSKYYYFDENGGNTAGVAAVTAPMPILTYEENLLTLAEAAARTQGFDQGLMYLNELRAFLASGQAFEKVNADDVLKYDAYEETDFEAGGMENADGIDKTRALLREIIQERYVSGYGSFMPWNDDRRIRNADPDLAVPFPINTTAATQKPERFLYAQTELNSNSNAPSGTTIYDKTEVNQ